MKASGKLETESDADGGQHYSSKVKFKAEIIKTGRIKYFNV